ncbi:MAG TPA: hypothetical protein VKD65_02620 [Candidatus Angelobacter sp.]|nr:hypothetical protein [Candidatus Angelobacter sp.]
MATLVPLSGSSYGNLSRLPRLAVGHAVDDLIRVHSRPFAAHKVLSFRSTPLVGEESFFAVLIKPDLRRSVQISGKKVLPLLVVLLLTLPLAKSQEPTA